MQLGARLLEQNMINQGELNHALSLQQKTGSRLGDILVSEGIIGYLPLYRHIAQHYELPFADLIQTPPDANLLRMVSAADCLQRKAIPWRQENGATYIATCDIAHDVKTWAKSIFGTDIRLVFTSPYDIRRAIETGFGNALDEASRLALWQTRPHASARMTFARWQKHLLLVLTLCTLAGAIWQPLYALFTIVGICHLAYSAVMLFKCIVFAEGAQPPSPASFPTTMDEKTLPVYSILVPMYREAESLPGLLAAIERLDYPAAKLDVKLVLETDDTETYNAALALKPRHHFDIIRVPKSQPRTKPKACNYALHFARGEFVTVFDADDIPEPQQLKKAVHAFRTLPPNVACLQARLNYHNANDNWLTRLFSLEYTMLFRFMLPGLERLGIPVPLGGTSNHIALSRLRELGDWDPFNVTEDADLGTRLAAHGWKTAMLDSDTLEESPLRVRPWIRQRSRWIKGYMQTWLVHMRHPLKLYQTLGFKGFFGFQCFVGLACFTFLTAPVVWAISILWLSDMTLPHWLAWMTMLNLLANFAMHWAFALSAAALHRQRRPAMLLAALTYPFYLVLHSIASYKALWQLVVRPHFWEKTTHGLAKAVDSTPTHRLEVQPIFTKARI